MKILVTGYSGVIGKYLAGSLSLQGYEVTVWPKSEVLDLTNSSHLDLFFKDRYFDTVIHCAAKGSKDPRSKDWSIMDSNLQMYYNLLAKRGHYGRFISIGSGAEFFINDRPYGLSKRVIRSSMLERDNFFNLRVFGVFNEEELDTRFIKANVLRYIRKEPIVIHQDKYMDFIYMDDLLKIVVHYLKNNDLSKEVDCVYPYTHKLSDIAEIINNLNKWKVDITIRQEEIAEGYCAFTKPLSLDFIGLEQGIRNVYNKLK